MNRPNIVFVLTDDQGYPDLGCTGNPWIQTPNIDQFSHEAVRMNDFHVAPLCAPTRGALMSGHRPTRNGVWATCWGRSLLGASEKLLSDYLLNAGYRTGMFGKWHLGDNYPYRPQDRGFEHVVAHKGGGVGQTPDFWGNNYFDDTYFRNGEPIKYDGYCTDVWFEQAMRFIRDNRGQPFFCYIATNAPHSPYLVPEKYARSYRGNPDIVEPEFYGMITNIDENFGRLYRLLLDLDIADDTILIFMTDNGSSGSARLDRAGHVVRGYNAGMRGMKGSYYDGGHRVPFFIKWKNGGLVNRDVDDLSLHVDFLPTILDLCGIEIDADAKLDGVSLAQLMRGERDRLGYERYDFVQLRQATEPPRKWSNAIISRDWRLVYGSELYDIKKDPGQCNDVSASYPDVVRHLRAQFERYWQEIAPTIDDYHPISLGTPYENPTRLDAMDVMGDVAWNQVHIAKALKSTGAWSVRFERTGNYTFELRRWPSELELPIDEPLDSSTLDRLAPYGSACVRDEYAAARMSPAYARIKLFGATYEANVNPGALGVSFVCDVGQIGQTIFEAWFLDEKHDSLTGAYYVYVTYNG